MSRLLCFISVGLLLSLPARASWRVESRPLEQRPYGRTVKPLITMRGPEGATYLEGAGVELKPGQAVTLFEVALPPLAERRTLELQLGYLTPTKEGPLGQACEVELTLKGAQQELVAFKVPLRSMDPTAEPFENLAAAYDYLMPQLSLPLRADATRLSVSAKTGSGCTAGRVLAFDPKVWREHPGVAPRRFFMLPVDSVSADWLETPHPFMPTVKRVFSASNGGALRTNVHSVSTNTNDTVLTLSRMRFVLRDAERLGGAREDVGGLVPSFLNAGYDVLGFTCNSLLSTLFQPSGFRSLYDYDERGSPTNERGAELTVEMMKSWLARHPDHDVMAYPWFSATHWYGSAPSWRPSLDTRQAPYKGPPQNLGKIELQARALSYTDLMLERLFESPQVRDADLFFFSDHGLNYETAMIAKPTWGSCDPNEKRPANHHVASIETRIPVGVRIRGYTPPVLRYETSLMDWLFSAVRHHNPEIDTTGWQGKDLAETSASDALLISSHGRRASMRVAGERLLFSDHRCSEGASSFFLDSLFKPAPAQQVERFLKEMDTREELVFQAMDISLLHGQESCKLDTAFPYAVAETGERIHALSSSPDRWMTRVRIYTPEVLGSAARTVHVQTAPPACGAVTTAGFSVHPKRPVNLAQLGLSPLMGLPGGDLKVTGAPMLHVQSVPGRFVRRGRSLVALEGSTDVRTVPRFSKDLRNAMKRWGYIQDDDHAP